MLRVAVKVNLGGFRTLERALDKGRLKAMNDLGDALADKMRSSMKPQPGGRPAPAGGPPGRKSGKIVRLISKAVEDGALFVGARKAPMKAGGYAYIHEHGKDVLESRIARNPGRALLHRKKREYLKAGDEAGAQRMREALRATPKTARVKGGWKNAMKAAGKTKHYPQRSFANYTLERARSRLAGYFRNIL